MKEKSKLLKSCGYPIYLIQITTLSNSINDEYSEDYKKITDFSINALNIEDSITKKSLEEIFNLDLSTISTFEDAKAFRNDDRKDDCKGIESFLNMKCDVMEKIKYIYEHSNKDGYLMDYSFLRGYDSKQRFNELCNSSLNSQIDINRLLATSLYLGIGCEKDIKSSIYRFKQNAFMGDISSLYFLREIYKELDDSNNFNLYDDLISLEKYLVEGRIDLPNLVKQKYSKEVKETYTLISMIKQNIGDKNDYINTSFMQIILNDDVSYKKKIECVLNYELGLYKDVLFSLINPSVSMGFKVKEEKENVL